MRKFSTKLIFLLLVSALFLPIIPVIAKTTPVPAQIPTFNYGVTGGAVGSWDGAIASAGFAGGTYSADTLEPMAMWPSDWDGDFDTMIPVLATSWNITWWPDDEMNYHPTDPFINKGGVRAIEFTLRDDVKFHDGSDWNATVAKWNIDRTMVISGNLTGQLTPDLMTDEMYKAIFSFWLPAEHWSQFETDTWNVSQFIGQPASYAEYGATKSDPANPYWGWLYNWAYDGAYCRIKSVNVTESKQSGGKVKIYFNDWSAIFLYVDDHTMISMDAYKDYFDTPIMGLGDVSGFEQPDVTGGYPTSGFPGHLIGTGPYRFIEHDDVLEQGTLDRFDDWWNASAMQAKGLHLVPKVAVVTFPLTQAGYQGRNLAMVTGTIDMSYDDGQLVYADMVADPDIDYVETGLGLDRDFITLNCINETYWKDFADAGPSVYNLSDPSWPGFAGDLTYLYDVNPDGSVNVDGVNRAMRKAVSYAFNYDTYINVIKAGRAERSDGFLPSTNEYYNPSFPVPYRDLTIARTAVLTDPFWAPLYDAKGLTMANLTEDDDWLWVANNDPVFEFKLLWDIANYDKASVFGNSIKDIGISLGGLNGAPDGNLLIQPDVYNVLFGVDVGSVPWFTSHGVPSNWGSLNYKYGPVAEYFYRSPGELPYVAGSYDIFPYEGLTNIGFHYNATVDSWIDKSWFADRTLAQELWDNMTRHFNTYQYAEIMISSTLEGFAIDKDWEFDLPRLTWAFLKYIEPETGDEGVQIPGFQTAILLAFTIVTITGIGYSLKRRTKRA